MEVFILFKIFKSLFKKNKKEADINLNTESNNIEASIVTHFKFIINIFLYNFNKYVYFIYKFIY